MKLNNHPFPVTAFLRKSLVLSFAVQRDDLSSRIPECLTLDLFEDRWAFVAVAMVQTEDLRPKGFPKILGKNFTLIGYRIFVRYRNLEGRNLRGLYILGSESNRAEMKRLGTLFTRYQYNTVSSQWVNDRAAELVTSDAGLRVKATPANDDAPLPDKTPFSTWGEARRFAGPMPFTFSWDPENSEVIIVEGKRSQWKPKPMSVQELHIPFLESPGLENAQLANAFYVENVPYEWKRGKVERWKP